MHLPITGRLFYRLKDPIFSLVEDFKKWQIRSLLLFVTCTARWWLAC